MGLGDTGLTVNSVRALNSTKIRALSLHSVWARPDDNLEHACREAFRALAIPSLEELVTLQEWWFGDTELRAAARGCPALRKVRDPGCNAFSLYVLVFRRASAPIVLLSGRRSST